MRKEKKKIANFRQSIHQPHQMYWFGKFWTLKANDDNGYVFVCRIWCASNSMPYFFFRSVFFCIFSTLSRFRSLHRILPAPKNVCRSISIFEWGQIVTLSLKDGFFFGNEGLSQAVASCCLFVYYLPNIFGFFLFLSFFLALSTEHPNRWPSFGVCV